MAYSELIKNFEKVRAYMREFYVYGFIWARRAAGNSVAAGSNPGRLTYSTQEVFR